MVVEIFLEIDEAFDCVSGDIKNEITLEITEGLNEILEILGIPETPKVVITKLTKEKVLPKRFMRIVINEIQCRYSDDLLIEIQNFVNRSYGKDDLIELGLTFNDTVSWLKKVLNDHDKEKTNTKRLMKFLCIACLEIVKLQPEILLGISQTENYLSSFQISKEHLGDVHQVLSEVISHRISISDTKKVKKIIEERLAENQSNEDMVEELITTLSPNIVQILVPNEYLEALKFMEKYNVKPGTVFELAFEDLFDELGFHYPKFQIAVNEDLNPNCFAFRINHLISFPQLGLKRDELLVNETSERLTLLKISGIPTINPINLAEESIIRIEYKQLVEDAGLTPVNHKLYVFMCLFAILRRYGSLFINVDYTKKILNKVSDLSLNEVISVESTTRLLRTLVSEEIPIVRIQHIFESILEYNLILREKDAIDLVDFVRSKLKTQISRKYSVKGNKLIVYLLNPDIETILLNYKSFGLKSPLDHPVYRKILSVIRDELGGVIAIRNPVILTKTKVSSILREIIAPECPRVVILSYNELSKEITVEPIGRLNLKD